MKIITVADVQYISHRYAKETMGFAEPIPIFETRFPNVLESCLAIPFQKFFGKVAYRGLEGKAAIMFYLMIKNHPFQNGNKRIAVTTLLVFLFKNSKWLKIDNQELYNFAVWVAKSPAELKNEVVFAIGKMVEKHLEDY